MNLTQFHNRFSLMPGAFITAVPHEIMKLRCERQTWQYNHFYFYGETSLKFLQEIPQVFDEGRRFPIYYKLNRGSISVDATP